MRHELELRPVRPDEWDAYLQAIQTAFGEELDEVFREINRQLTELDRTLAAFDGGRIVGTSENQTMELTVPGGSTAPMAGVTSVAVLPTHRRRGVMRSLVRGLLDEAAGRGEPLAGLWASEFSIYGRFGFGCAARGARYEIARVHGAFTRPPGDGGGLRLVDPDEALRVFPPVYEAVRRRVPGLLRRDRPRWSWIEHDPDSWRDGAGPRAQAVLEDRGYVVWRLKEHWTDQGPAHELDILELMASDDEAYAVLWRWCLDMDLVATVKASGRAPDDPLPHLLADRRRLLVKSHDTLWLCLLDVETALSSRRYPLDGSLTFGVTDGFVPHVDGVYRLEVDGGTGVCERADTHPDLTLSAADLAAVYLGGTRLQHLARAGRVDEHRSGALVRADLMFSSSPLPWCPWEF